MLMKFPDKTQLSAHAKDKNSIFTARDEDMIFLVKGKILVFHQYLYNKYAFVTCGNTLTSCMLGRSLLEPGQSEMNDEDTNSPH